VTDWLTAEKTTSFSVSCKLQQHTQKLTNERMRGCVWAGHYDTVTICNTPNCTSSSRITVVQYELHNKIIFKARLYQISVLSAFLHSTFFKFYQKQPKVEVLIVQNS
jgi:hypothetical protein